MAKTEIIIGASRGLGLGLATELTRRGWQVTATQRTPSPDLAAVAGVTVETVDIDDPASVAALAACAHGPFDLVFINAGIMGDRAATADTVSRDALTALMMTNAISPIRTARALRGAVKPGGTVAFMTSVLGSVALRTHGVAELYSASKAALNSLTRGFAAVEASDLAVLSLHPGWVRTAMGGDGAAIDVATSVAGLADLIETETAPGHRYLDYTGKTLPW